MDLNYEPTLLKSRKNPKFLYFSKISKYRKISVKLLKTTLKYLR